MLRKDGRAAGGDPRSGRRASGALESAVLDVLWAAGAPLSAGEVRERLAAVPSGAGGSGGSGGTELSYSTVVTILSRLHEKKALVREPDGRAFRYAPVADAAGLAARRLSAMLDSAPDRAAVLSRFFEELSDRDEQMLRELLDHRSADRVGGDSATAVRGLPAPAADLDGPADSASASPA